MWGLRGLGGVLRRNISGPRPAQSLLPARGLDEFKEQAFKPGEPPVVGRAWKACELRRKSFEDLHRLWFVLYKENNLLLTEKLVSRRTGVPMVARDRKHKVKRSMKAIRVVLGERQRLKQAVLKQEAKEVRAAERAAERAREEPADAV